MKKILRCLLVDDDIDDRELFLMIIQTLGEHIQCSTAVNGPEALRLLQETGREKPDYIFLDVNMPKMNGMDCLEQLRMDESLNACKVFMYSTTSEESMVERSRKLGADFMIKPADLNELKEMLEKILIRE